MDTINARILARRDTTLEWNSNRSFIPMRGEIIIYTDYGKIYDEFGNETNVPGVKIGDGSAYLIDLPFVNDNVKRDILQELGEHANNTNIHVTSTEKDFWNNKLNFEVFNGNLILNRN